MPSYQYKAVDKTGQPARGGLEAVNEVDLELRLRRMGLDLITFQQVDRRASMLAAGGKVTRKDLINFCFDMEQMNRSGIPLIDGLRDLRDSIDSPRFREILTSMTEDMDSGKVMSQCMAAHPEVFDGVFVSLIKAAEQTGQIAEVFQSLADSLKWQDELAAQTKRLLIYPSMVLVVVLGVMTFLLIYLVPQVAGLLKTMGLALPVQTRVLIFLSGIVVSYWYIVFGTPIAAVMVLAIAIRRSPRLQYLWDHVKLRVPP